MAIRSELTIARARRSPLRDVHAVRIEHLNPRIRDLRDEEIARRVGHSVIGIVELAVPRT